MPLSVLLAGLPANVNASGALSLQDLKELVQPPPGGVVYTKADTVSVVDDNVALEMLDAFDLCVPADPSRASGLREVDPEVAPPPGEWGHLPCSLWGPQQSKVCIVGQYGWEWYSMEVPVSGSTTGAELQSHVEALLGIPASEQLLFVSQQPPSESFTNSFFQRSSFYLTDNCKSQDLASLGVCPGAIIMAFRMMPDKGYQVFVKTVTGRTITVECRWTMTVAELKEQIHAREGVPPNHQRLIFAGNQLEDHATVADYKVLPESTLHVVLRLWGGMFHSTSGREDFTELGGEEGTRDVEVVRLDGSSLTMAVRYGATIAEIKQQLLDTLRQHEAGAEGAADINAVLAFDAEGTDDVEALRRALRQAQAALRKL